MPPIARRTGKLTPTSLRMTAEVREKLEQAASNAGRSLTMEMQIRLERSFDQPVDWIETIRRTVRDEIRSALSR